MVAVKPERRPDARATPALGPQLPNLSSAEERVLPYLCAGWNDHEIAIELGLPDTLIREQVNSCLLKFGATCRAQLAARLLLGESRLKRPD